MDKARVSRKARSLKLGYAGLGKMGLNMVERLRDKGHRVVAFDLDPKAVAAAAKLGAKPAGSPADLVRALAPPRLIWLMVPHQAVDALLDELVPLLGAGDVVIDGGNSFYKDSVRRAKRLAEKGIDFLDVGVSGGPGGARRGACIMVGGRKETCDRFQKLFRDLSLPGGFAYIGDSGSGHFVKMVHNGIEYGMMQALAEGFSVLRASPYHLDLEAVARLYNHGSVITSRLVGWLADAFSKHGQELKDISGAVSQSGEGMWTVETGRELAVPTAVIERAVAFRTESQAAPSYTGQVVSALRHEFGLHEVSKTG